MGIQLDDQTRKSFESVLEDVRVRQMAKEQACAELQDLRKSVEVSFDPGSSARVKARLLEIKAEFPHEKKIQEVCEEVAGVLDARGEEEERIVAELTQMAETAKQVPLGESTGLLRRATELSANYAMEPQIGALIQQIDYELNRRLAQRQALLGEMEQLESAASRARSLAGLSQLINHAHSVASAAAGDQEVASALVRVNAAAEVRRRTISRLLTEVNELADKALIAQSVGDAEQLVTDAQRRVSAYPERHPRPDRRLRGNLSALPVLRDLSRG